MELLQLRYFYESAATESFAATAKRHMVPTTSVSAAVGRLEKELGKQLFDRMANRIVLNENGRVMQRVLCTVFDKLDSVTETMKSEVNERKISLLVRTERKRVTDLLIKFLQINPTAKFEAIYDFENEEIDGYDVIIDCDHPHYNSYDKYEFYNKKLGFKVISTHPLCGKQLNVSDLAGERFLTMGEKTNAHKILVSACAAAGFVPNIVMQCNDALCYGRCISSGLGIGIGDINRVASNVAVLNVGNFSHRHVSYIYYKSHAKEGMLGRLIEFLKCGE